MQGDFSRRTYDPRKHYSAVVQEQGRLLTDADLDEEHRILAGTQERTAADLIGGCGGPIGAAGFAVTSPDGVNLELSAGRYYAAGMLLTNETTVDYTAQPDRFAGDIAWPPAPGRYAIVLDTWRRLITALDDPSIREVALGGPTTSAREVTVWQARHVAVDAGWVCSDPLPPAPATTGSMAARAEPEAVESSPCLVPPLAGYTGLENQFYRVEVFTPGGGRELPAAPTVAIVAFPAGTTNQVELAAPATLSVGDVVEVVATGPGSDPLEATFAQVADVSGAVVTLTAQLPEFAPADAPVLRPAGASVVISRENGSVVTAIERIEGLEVTVSTLGPDDELGFAPGHWVELSDDAVELEHRPRQLRQIEAIDPDRRVVTLRTPATPLAAPPEGVRPARHPKLRRWDAARAIVFRADGTAWIPVENGIQIRFGAGPYRSGDYWQFPARAAIVDAASGTIEWPQRGGQPADLPPAGVVHHFCPLAVVDVGGKPAAVVVADCRNLFPPGTELTTLLYVGGDGQEARPGSSIFPRLPAPLTVRVTNGSHPVPGARVKFAGSGQLIPTASATDESGLLSCAWRLDPSIGAQTCVAHLLDPAGTEIAHQVVRFHATIDAEAGDTRGCCVCVGPGKDFEEIEGAISALLERGKRDLCLCLTPGDHQVGIRALPPPDLEGLPFTLSIKGCGRGTRVHPESGVLIEGWASVRLADLDLDFGSGPDLLIGAVPQVSLENVHVRGAADTVALVRIHDASRVSVGKCVLEAGGAGDAVRLKDVFAGLAPLEGIWDEIGGEGFAQAVHSAAAEVARLPLEQRRTHAAAIQRKATDGRRRFSAGLVTRLVQLSSVLAAEQVPVTIAGAIHDVKAALAVQSNRVALEIGAGNETGDPASVTRAEIIIADNVIAGNISFYGPAGGPPLDDDVLSRLKEHLKEPDAFGGLSGTVHLRDNRFNRLLISEGMHKALRNFAVGPVGPGNALLTLYETFLMTNNVIDGANSELAAQHAVLTSNEFTLAGLFRSAVPLLVLNLIADTAIATGNHGDTVPGPDEDQPFIEETTRLFTESVNLELRFP